MDTETIDQSILAEWILEGDAPEFPCTWGGGEDCSREAVVRLGVDPDCGCPKYECQEHREMFDAKFAEASLSITGTGRVFVQCAACHTNYMTFLGWQPLR